MSDATILLVDDEKTILDSLKQQLRRNFGRRFAYETAENATEAFELIEELEAEGVRIVVIVSDWLMPEVRGDEFLARVKATHPGIVRIMLTGQADAEAISRVAQQDLAQRILHKPWRIDELAEVIELGLAG